MPRHLCTSWADETDEERGADSIVDMDDMQFDDNDWELANHNDHDDHNDDYDGSQTTNKRLAGRLDKVEDPSRVKRLAGRLD